MFTKLQTKNIKQVKNLSVIEKNDQNFNRNVYKKKQWSLTMSAVMERILQMVLVIYHRMERFITIVRKIFLSPLDVINSVVLGSNLSVKDSVPECAKGMTVGLAYKPALVQMFVRIVLLKEKKSHSERIGKGCPTKKFCQSSINKNSIKQHKISQTAIVLQVLLKLQTNYLSESTERTKCFNLRPSRSSIRTLSGKTERSR